MVLTSIFLLKILNFDMVELHVQCYSGKFIQIAKVAEHVDLQCKFADILLRVLVSDAICNVEIRFSLCCLQHPW